jgi:hypothetical protein
MAMPKNATWAMVYTDDIATVWQNENDDIHFKVKVNNKTKQFYNETAWSDVPRFLTDETGYLKYWSIFE